MWFEHSIARRLRGVGLLSHNALMFAAATRVSPRPNTPSITASRSAPAAMKSTPFVASMPPMAAIGMDNARRARRGGAAAAGRAAGGGRGGGGRPEARESAPAPAAAAARARAGGRDAPGGARG